MICRGVEFRGTNLWVLIFATMIASLGLNVNSAAVIIGAMLVSPLMGPIMGVGLSLGSRSIAPLSFVNPSPRFSRIWLFPFGKVKRAIPYQGSRNFCFYIVFSQIIRIIAR